MTVASENGLSWFDLILVNRTITDKEPFINERVLSGLVRGRQLQETTQCPTTNPLSRDSPDCEFKKILLNYFIDDTLLRLIV